MKEYQLRTYKIYSQEEPIPTGETTEFVSPKGKTVRLEWHKANLVRSLTVSAYSGAHAIELAKSQGIKHPIVERQGNKNKRAVSIYDLPYNRKAA